MKVVELPLNRLDPNGQNAFDPLIEAIPGVRPVVAKSTRITSDDISIGESHGELSEGEGTKSVRLQPLS